MQYIVIGLVIIVLFLSLYIAKLKGYRVTKEKPEEMPKDQKEAAKRKAEEFDKVMNYNLDQALRRKRVM